MDGTATGTGVEGGSGYERRRQQAMKERKGEGGYLREESNGGCSTVANFSGEQRLPAAEVKGEKRERGPGKGTCPLTSGAHLSVIRINIKVHLSALI